MRKIKVKKEIYRLSAWLLGFVLVTSLMGGHIVDAWTPPPGSPPSQNVSPPIHEGTEDQAKEGDLSVGTDVIGLGTLNICTSGDSCSICLNGDDNCITDWPSGSGSGSDLYWGYTDMGGGGSNFIYPKIPTPLANFKIYSGGSTWINNADLNIAGTGNIYDSGDLKVGGYANFNNSWALNENYGTVIASTTLDKALYVKANVAAIEAETLNDGVTVPTPGRGAIFGRDDNSASVGNIVWGVMGMSAGTTSTALAYLNYGVYGYAPDVEDGVGVRGTGGKVGVHGYGGVGVIGGGGYGGQFTGAVGAAAYSYSGGTGLIAIGQDTVDPDLGTGADISGPQNTQAIIATLRNRGGVVGGGGSDPVPELDASGIGVMGVANRYPVVGFQGGVSRTYGSLGSNNSAYGGLMGAFGRGDNYGVYGYSPSGIGVNGISNSHLGVFACIGGDVVGCANALPAENYALYAVNLSTAQDAIKGICNGCNSAIAAIQSSTTSGKNALYGQVPQNSSSNYAGIFDGQLFIDGTDWQDAENIGVIIGGSEKSGDSIAGTKNLWLYAKGGQADTSVRINSKLDVNGAIATKTDVDYVRLTGESQGCGSLPTTYGTWQAAGTFDYLNGSSVRKTATLCVLRNTISW